MNLKNLFLTFVVIGLVIGASGNLAAQESQRFEVFGSVGVSNYAEFFAPGSTSPSFGGGIGVRPFSADHRIPHRLGLELEVDTVNEKQFSGGLLGAATYTGSRRQVLVLGDVLYHFIDGRAQPYILAGFGTAKYPTYNRAGAIGAGVKIFVRKNVSIRPEFRLAATHDATFSARGTFAVGFHW